MLQLNHPGILIAREVLPSDMAALDHDLILGIVTESGEKNSQAVIMAKALGIPARVVISKDCGQEFLAYGTPTQDLPDPVARAVAELRDQVASANARIVDLERKLEEVASLRPAAEGTAGPNEIVTPLRRHAEG